MKNREARAKNVEIENNKKRKKANKEQIENKKVEEEKPKKKRKWLKRLLLIVLIALIAYAGWFWYKTQKNGGGLSGMLATVVGHDEFTKKNLPELQVLLLGVSTDLGEESPTDTIMVASYNPDKQTANLVSVPRDTFIGTNRNTAQPGDKINSVYSYGGAEKSVKMVNRVTGLELEHYVVIKTNALIELVDAIGGVQFNVPIDMKYDDPTQDLHIDLKAGMQEIDGEKAEQLLRFRHNNNGSSYPDEYGDNDTGRMRTQRDFIMAVMQQTLKVENIFKIGQILDVASKSVETDLNWDMLKDYIPYVVEFSTENLVTDTIPGTNIQLPEKASSKWWFFEANKKETEKLMQKLFNPIEEEEENTTENNITNSINSNNTNSTNTASTNVAIGTQTNTTEAPTVKTSPSSIKLEVLNGTGETVEYERAVEILKQKGYNVQKTGKTTEISKTIITNKKEIDLDAVKAIKQALGGTGSISNNKQLSSKVDITIVIGKDFNQ